MDCYVGLEKLRVSMRDVTKGDWLRGQFMPSVRQLLETHTFGKCYACYAPLATVRVRFPKTLASLFLAINKEDCEACFQPTW